MRPYTYQVIGRLGGAGGFDTVSDPCRHFGTDPSACATNKGNWLREFTALNQLEQLAAADSGAGLYIGNSEQEFHLLESL